MAMPSANVIMSEKTQYLSGGGVGWYADERDGFISWLRGEFAAANAIIDSLCNHLKSISEGGEYDEVIGSIQQRRCNWNPVLHMQQYFSIGEVLYALQQATWRRQQHNPVKIGGPGKDFKRSGGVRSRQGQGHKVEISVKNGHNSIVANVSSNVCSDVHVENDSSSMHIAHVKPNISTVAKTFVVTEMLVGKQINAVEGMKLYEKFFDDSEVGKMVSLVNDLRIAGRQGKFQGQTYVVSKRPMKGHGREMIQLGLPIADAPFQDDVIIATSKEQKIEPIPSLFQDIIERLMAIQVLTVKPDSCIIDIFNEGDHSHPHMWPHWFGRPVCVLFVTECDVAFGRVITSDHPGDFRGSVNLSLTPGSMLIMEGRSADFARHAIPSIRKQRILITFTKSQPNRITPSDSPRSPSHAPPSHWIPPPNHIRHPMVHKQAPCPHGIQPIFIPAAVTPAVPFPASPVALPPVSGGGWPRLPLPGTGVFLPPGGNSTPQKENAEEDCNGSCNGNGGELATVGGGEQQQKRKHDLKVVK